MLGVPRAKKPIKHSEPKPKVKTKKLMHSELLLAQGQYKKESHSLATEPEENSQIFEARTLTRKPV